MREGSVRLIRSCLVFTEKSVLPEDYFEAIRHNTLRSRISSWYLCIYHSYLIEQLDHNCLYLLYGLFQKPIFSPAGFTDGATIRTIPDILYFINFKCLGREKHKSDGKVLKNYEIIVFLWHQLIQEDLETLKHKRGI